MIVLKHLYNDINGLKKQLASSNFNLKNDCTVEIYTANFSKDEAVFHANAIKDLLPNSKIFGISACGVVYDGEQFDNGTVVIVKSYSRASSTVLTFSWENKSAEDITQQIANVMQEIDPKIMNVVFSDHYCDAHDFVALFNQKGPGIKLVGGIAGDIFSKQIMGYVFTEEGIKKNSVIINALSGKNFNVFCARNIACEPISPVYTVTQTDGPIWETIDNIPATTWFRDHLGEYTTKDYYGAVDSNNPFVRLQMLLEGHNDAGRHLNFDNNLHKITQSISCVPSGTKFRIGYASPTKCVQHSYEICSTISENPIEDLFSYSCIIRKLYNSNSTTWELSPFRQYNICGAFLLGEFADIDGTNEFLNGSTVLYGIGEKEQYIFPDMSVFESLQNIEEGNSELLAFVLKKQNNSITSENNRLLKNILTQQDVIKKHLYIDAHIGIKNLLKYKEDSKITNFNKLCMIHVSNMDDLINFLGLEGYYQHLKKQANTIVKFLKTQDQVSFYTVNTNTFIATSSAAVQESAFLKMITTLYEMFHFTNITNTAIPIINRFIVVLHHEDLLKTALHGLSINEHSHEQYIVFDKDNNLTTSSHSEKKVLDVLSYALENDCVVPYYQGIYDNKKHHIQKFEALMRIVDEDGVVYTPFQFMDIAKKYHMYPLISAQMIARVIKDFDGLNKMVSINLSAYDINSKSFREKFFKMLGTLKTPSTFILEILEDEKFRDLTFLKNFILKAKKYGVKIAIDDFGSGYSNLLEIATIAPDYIKVDGGIIKDVSSTNQNRLVLDTIIYLAEKMGCEVIAEYVENEEIYNYIASTSIQYSQGYYFAMPTPIEDLDLSI